MMAEMSAEIGFPLSESLTYGFIEAFKHLFLFLINFITAMLVNPLQDELKRHEQQKKFIGFYYSILILLVLMVAASITMFTKSNFVMHREESDGVDIDATQTEALSELDGAQSQRSESGNLELESNFSYQAEEDV